MPLEPDADSSQASLDELLATLQFLRRRARAYLTLTRPANVVTAAADILAGFAAVGSLFAVAGAAAGAAVGAILRAVPSSAKKAEEKA